jgi:hypothetical protein
MYVYVCRSEVVVVSLSLYGGGGACACLPVCWLVWACTIVCLFGHVCLCDVRVWACVCVCVCVLVSVGVRWCGRV